MKRKNVLSSTRVDSHGMRMTRAALAGNAIASKGPRAIGMGVDHDLTLPPVGKILNSYIVPTNDGEFELVGTQERMETVGEVVMPDGRVFVRQACPSDSRPFMSAQERLCDKPVVSVDPVNFKGHDPRNAFFDHLDDVCEYEPDLLLRKSHIPDPEMVIHAGEVIIGWFSAHKLLNKTTTAIDEDIASFYKLITRSVFQFAKTAIPKNRPKTYVVIVPGTPTVQFVARTKHAKQALAAMHPLVLKPHLDEAMELANSFRAEKVQFSLQEDGTWKVSFMLTTNGQVIGDPYIIKHRDQVLQSMQDSSRRNVTD